jgi:hypothetical protein
MEVFAVPPEANTKMRTSIATNENSWMSGTAAHTQMLVHSLYLRSTERPKTQHPPHVTTPRQQHTSSKCQAAMCGDSLALRDTFQGLSTHKDAHLDAENAAPESVTKRIPHNAR